MSLNEVRPKVRRHLLVLVGALVVAVVAACSPAPTPGPSGGGGGGATGRLAPLASAWGVDGRVTLGGVTLAGLGANPSVDLPRNPFPYHDYQASAATVRVPVPARPDLVRTGALAVSARYEPALDGSSRSTRSMAETAGVNLLNGLITADAVRARAHTTISSAGVDHHTTMDGFPGRPDGSTGSELVNLVIAGQQIPLAVAPNTRINLAGLGYVVLNEQVVSGPVTPAGAAEASPGTITVNALHLFLTTGTLRGEVRVSHLDNGFGPAGYLPVDAWAYFVKGNVAPVASVGALNGLGLPGQGTGGQDLVKNLAEVNLPPVVNSAVATSTVNSSVDGNRATATSRATGVRLLNGLITADAITSRASTGIDATGVSSRATGTSFLNLRIAGRPIDATVGPNTRIDLDRLGYVVVNQQSCDAAVDDPAQPGDQRFQCQGAIYNQMDVVALHIHVTIADNVLGLPVGADITVVHAHTSGLR